MTNDLETALRDMLAERAGDITTLPPRLTHPDQLSAAGVDLIDPGEPHHPARTSRWLLAAAVALIIAIAGTIVGLRQLADHPQPAAPNTVTPTSTPTSPSPSPTPTPTTSTTANAAGIPLACKATLPPAWKAALSGNAGSSGGPQGFVLSAADGNYLIERDLGWDKPREVVLVSGNRSKTVFDVPDPNRLDVQSAYLAGKWVVVSVGVRPRQHAKHTIPGSSPMPNVTGVYVVSLESGTTKQIASGRPNSRGPSIDRAVEMDGRVYWDVTAHYNARTGVIKAYDLASGTTSTVYSGPVGYFPFSPGGVGANGSGGVGTGDTVVVRAELPPTVTRSLNPRYPLYVATDGTAYVWLANHHQGKIEIGWWAPDSGDPTYLRIPLSGQIPGYPSGFLLVSGRFVFVQFADVLVDMRTGSMAGKLPHNPTGVSGSDLMFGTILVRDGHWDSEGYWIEPTYRSFHYQPANLPDLHC